jgi:hypothetical protein
MSTAKPFLLSLGLAVVVVVGLFAWTHLIPYGMNTAQAQDSVRELRGADAEFYYLGEEVDGLHLAAISDPEGEGRLIFQYGRCMDNDEGGCNRPLNVISTPVLLGANDHLPAGDCVRQVLGEGNEVLIHLSQVEITYWNVVSDGYMTNFPRSKALVPKLRRVGASSPPPCAPAST